MLSGGTGNQDGALRSQGLGPDLTGPIYTCYVLAMFGFDLNLALPTDIQPHFGPRACPLIERVLCPESSSCKGQYWQKALECGKSL